MTSYVAFLRGVNVGGHGKLAMKPLCAAMELAEYANVTSYIQSGNLVFDYRSDNPEETAASLTKFVENHAGFAPEALVITKQVLANIHANCPFDTVGTDPKTLHFLFLKSSANQPDLTKIRDLQAPNEEFEITDKAVYFLAPSGIGRSKLMAKFERLLGVPVTTRNLNTVQAVMALSQG